MSSARCSACGCGGEPCGRRRQGAGACWRQSRARALHVPSLKATPSPAHSPAALLNAPHSKLEAHSKRCHPPSCNHHFCKPNHTHAAVASAVCREERASAISRAKCLLDALAAATRRVLFLELHVPVLLECLRLSALHDTCVSRRSSQPFTAAAELPTNTVLAGPCSVCAARTSTRAQAPPPTPVACSQRVCSTWRRAAARPVSSSPPR